MFATKTMEYVVATRFYFCNFQNLHAVLPVGLMEKKIFEPTDHLVNQILSIGLFVWEHEGKKMAYEFLKKIGVNPNEAKQNVVWGEEHIPAKGDLIFTVFLSEVVMYRILETESHDRK